MRTVQQAANALGISPQRVRLLIKDGRIRADKIGVEWNVRSLKIGPALNPSGWPKGRPRK